jgi:serine/threonine-protein kinase
MRLCSHGQTGAWHWGQPESEPVELIKGKYKIVREIARSNDIVYEALDTSLNRRIALKELNLAPSLVGHARRDRIERFHREARAAGRLSHPNIVSVFEFGEENGRHYIAMEFLDGQNLRDVLQMRGPLPQHEALDIICQVLSALAYAHAHSVIHRDIKPDNIHILPGGHIKLADFGIARLTEEIALTGDGQIFGTPSYMSPEQIVGKGIDSRSDLFSAGVVLYEMLTGRKPFIGDNVVSITYAIMNAPAPALTGVPEPIERVIFSALAKDPAQRPASADRMRADLLAAERMPAAPASPSGPPSTPVGPASGPMQGAPPGFGLPSMPLPGGPQGYAMPGATWPPQDSAALQGGQPQPTGPWGWNGALLGMGTAGAQPGQRRFRRRRPAFTLPTLSPAARTLVAALAIAVVLAGCIVGAVVAFMGAYEGYRQTALDRRVSDLVTQGVNAYNAGNFSGAAECLEQAKAANPSAAQLHEIAHDLGAAYMATGVAAQKAGNFEAAKRAYRQACAANPASSAAQEALQQLQANRVIVLPAPVPIAEPHGSASRGAPPQGPAPAQTTVSAPQAEPGPAEAQPAAPAVPPSLAPPASGVSPEAVQQAEAEKAGRASQLLSEGDTAARSGDMSTARSDWLEVIRTYPGTDIADTANSRLRDSR